MSEQVPSTNPEVAAPHVSVETFEQKMLEASEPINEASANVQSAKDKVDALNFKSDATDRVRAKAELRDANTALSETEAAQQPVIDSMNEEWLTHGGARVDAARAAVDALNFKSDAIDHVRAKAELRDAKIAWEESYNARATENDNEANAAPEAPVNEPETTEAAPAEAPEVDIPAEEATPSSESDDVLEGEIVDEPAMSKELVVIEQPAASKELVVIDTPNKELATTELPVVEQSEKKGRVWTWKQMLRDPGGTIAAIISDRRRMRELYYDDEAVRTEKLSRNRNILFGTLAVITAAILFKETADAAGNIFNHAQDAHAGVAAAGGYAGSDPDLNPKHMYTFNHDVVPVAPAPHTEFINSAANNIQPGEGGMQYLQDQGVPNPLETWRQHQDAFLQANPTEAYRMPNGDVGLKHPGKLSEAAVEWWANTLGR